jgi:uncharacterized membrane protein YccC
MTVHLSRADTRLRDFGYGFFCGVVIAFLYFLVMLP